ncbi:hypothetical protein ACIBW9_25320 [Streptomyces sp. NPDC049541]|uniref:hypothetical protein n=1 Tax=Streptomyces sp. NPDC049541 TaxID=3365594 RepID=UPI00379A75BC
MTLRRLVEQVVSEQFTAEQIAERVAADREVLRERMGCTLTDEQFGQEPDALVDLYAMATEKMHSLRGRSA